VNCKFLNFGVKIEKPTKLQGLKVNFPQIIHILSPTAKITRQARKYREKEKQQNLQHSSNHRSKERMSVLAM
jgi:hypothetical protein